LSYPNFDLDLNASASTPNASDPLADQNTSYQPPAEPQQHQEKQERREREGSGQGRGSLVSRVIVPLPPGLSSDEELTPLKFDEEGNLSLAAWQFGDGGDDGGGDGEWQQPGTSGSAKSKVADRQSNARSKPRPPRPRFRPHPIFWPLLVAVVISVYLIWLLFYLSTPVKVVAQVGFQRELVNTQSISLALDLTRSTEGSLTILQSPLPLEANNSQLASYFKTVEVSTIFTVTTITTGKKLVPDKTATGQLEMGSRNTVTLPAGTVVARVGTVEYRLTRTVTIPGFDVISGRGGTALAAVTASVPGSGGNARLGASLLESFGYPGVAVRGGNVTGGTDREVQVVTEQDLEKLRAELDASLTPTGTTAASLRATAQAQLAKSASSSSPTSDSDGQPARLLVLSLAEFGTGNGTNGKNTAKIGFKEVSELDETSLQIFGREDSYGSPSPSKPGDEATQIVATLTAKARVYVVQPQGLVEYLYLNQRQGQGQDLANNPNQAGSSRPSFKLERESQSQSQSQPTSDTLGNSNSASVGKIGLKLTVSYSIAVTQAQRQEIVTRLANWRGNATQLSSLVRELTNKPGVVAYIELPKLPQDVSSRNNLELIVVAAAY
jgi:hypothetical protein